MSKENKENQSPVFEDLLEDKPISQLKIEEPETSSFDMASVAYAASSEVSQKKPAKGGFGKRASRHKTAQAAVIPATKDEPAPQPAVQKAGKPEPEAKIPEHMTYTAMLKEARSKAKAKESGPQPVKDDAIMTLEPVEKPEHPSIQDMKPAARKLLSDKEEQLFDDFEKKEEQAKEEQIDPEASLVDDYDYDLYVDKKRFLLSDYSRVESYLEKQSQQGFHYVRHEDKKYFFKRSKPHDYYYQVIYCADEPDEEQQEAWAQDGWVLMHQAPGRKKREAGWFVLRNELEPGDLKKTIENEEEKLHHFKKYSNSCRSTLFLLFIVMAICAVTFYLQYAFNGFLYAMAASAIFFVIALIMFIIYGRMLAKSKKQVRLLEAKLRLNEKQDEAFEAMNPETEEELNADWESLDSDKPKKRSQKNR